MAHDPSVLHDLAVCAAGVLAGGVNALAGGGTIISFPALQALGLPAVNANVTNTVALSPGYFAGTWAQRADLEGQRRALRPMALVAGLGGLAGSVILLEIPSGDFRAAVPFLILAACALLLGQGKLRALIARRTAAAIARAAGLGGAPISAVVGEAAGSASAAAAVTSATDLTAPAASSVVPPADVTGSPVTSAADLTASTVASAISAADVTGSAAASATSADVTGSAAASATSADVTGSAAASATSGDVTGSASGSTATGAPDSPVQSTATVAAQVSASASPPERPLPRRAELAAVLACSVYGGFFGAGLGIMLLAVLGLFSTTTMVRNNAVKQALALVINAIAALFFAWSGKVDWVDAGLLAVSAVTGASIGGRLVHHVDPRVLRVFVVLLGIGVAIRYWV